MTDAVARYRVASAITLEIGPGFPADMIGELRRSLDPAPLVPDGDVPAGPVLRLEWMSGAPAFDEIQALAGDGLVTASGADAFYALIEGRPVTVPDPFGDSVPTIGFPPDARVDVPFRTIVRPAMQLLMPRADAVALHGSSLERDGDAIIIGGWSEAGKTETALAMMEASGRFISDKWTVVLRGESAETFPIGVGIRRWVLPYLPKLRASLPPTARAQFALARVSSVLTAPMGAIKPRARGSRLMVRSARRAAALIDRAAVGPTRLRQIYGDGLEAATPEGGVPIRAVVALRTVPAGDPVVRPGEADRVAWRLARSAAVERGTFFAYLQRRAYSESRREATLLEQSVREDAVRIARLLENVTCLEVAAPFPTDPRRVADAIDRAL